MEIKYQLQTYNVAVCAMCEHLVLLHDDEEGCLVERCTCKEKDDTTSIAESILDSQIDNASGEDPFEIGDGSPACDECESKICECDE
jgi:hypothetical protein